MEHDVTPARSAAARASDPPRHSFSKISEPLPIEDLDLVAIQRSSFEWLTEEGLGEVLSEISPIEDFTGQMALSFSEHRFDEPKNTVEECKTKDLTYAAPLFVTAEFVNRSTGEIKSQTVFMGDFPMMTDQGTFIINGTERIVVSQLVRSPGVYFDRTFDKSTGQLLHGCKIIPSRGAWLEFEIDKRGMVGVRVDRKRKQHITVLYRALKGLVWNPESGEYELADRERLDTPVTDEEILDFFDHDEGIRATLEKDVLQTPDEALQDIYRKLRPGEPPTAESAGGLLINLFFNPKRYDLAKVGRYKANKKLGEELVRLGLADVDEASWLVDDHGVPEPLQEAEGQRTGIGEVAVSGEDRAPLKSHTLTKQDVLATMSYMVNLSKSGEEDRTYDHDDIDHFGNRRLRSVGELIQNQVRIGLSRMERVVRERMTTQDVEAITPQTLINIRPVVASIKEFFGASQLSQFMDQTNPLSGLTHKRRLSALGPGGLSRERAGFEVRDVHPSHYGRMCPIETPEGPNIGLIGSLATYARINPFGFVETPYRKVEDGTVTDRIDFLTADEEDRNVIAQANAPLDNNGHFTNPLVLCRARDGEVREVLPEEVDYMDVSPRQTVSVAAAMIPFLEHDDANRALMGTNMQRQAVPLVKSQAPYVGTGLEGKSARDAGDVIVVENDGIIVEVAADRIISKTTDGRLEKHFLRKFERTNQGTCYSQKPLVDEGDEVVAGQVVADGPCTDYGEIALGANLMCAFMSWEGFNFEDAVIISERLVKDDVMTSIHIEEYEIDARDTKLGAEEITRDIPNVGEEVLGNLDERGIIRIGAEVSPGDILVGKVTPKGETELTPEERLLRAIFGEKAREVRDTSLKVPHGESGRVIGVRTFSREAGDEMPPGVNELVRVYVAQKRKISDGDKLAGRHGNKGVIAKVLPEEDMPFLPDGTPVEIILNPLGVPSRMNVGQVLETHLGWVAANGWSFDSKPEWFDDVGWNEELLESRGGERLATPVFDGCRERELGDLLAHTQPNQDGDRQVGGDGKARLIDGRTGEPVDQPITVGYMYILKLLHLVDDKIHARSTGPYSMITQQPLGGKAQFGGQRFGEMEVWALEAYGASYALQELLTVKSDDVLGRVKVYEAIVKGDNIPEPGIPESFKVLVKEMQSLCLNVEVLSAEGQEIEFRESDDDAFRAAEELGIDLSRPERYSDEFQIGSQS
ncbi:DNA-directed RNA polymerase subunit beta [Egibacter rhizosphaerae]|uniref:DNA-directed RNA polymerase subunit beta n=1 Tax=Egibacter rhizosphaerae TaxID=1670831 RepID=A0A411YLH1_9ACTN|nr:DNA-directed RNA polymerase subunit beta [Egibacter rhizosphaerae]